MQETIMKVKTKAANKNAISLKGYIFPTDFQQSKFVRTCFNCTRTIPFL